MSLETILGSGVLLVGGLVFALYLGVSSMRFDHEREEQAGRIV